MTKDDLIHLVGERLQKSLRLIAAAKYGHDVVQEEVDMIIWVSSKFEYEFRMYTEYAGACVKAIELSKQI